MPHSLLADVFRRLLEQHHSVEDIVRTWQGLALVCKGWLAALREATPLCVELTKPQHLGPAAQRWLSRVPLEASGAACLACCSACRRAGCAAQQHRAGDRPCVGNLELHGVALHAGSVPARLPPPPCALANAGAGDCTHASPVGK